MWGSGKLRTGTSAWLPQVKQNRTETARALKAVFWNGWALNRMGSLGLSHAALCIYTACCCLPNTETSALTYRTLIWYLPPSLILWPPDMKNWLIAKDPDADKDWRQEEKGGNRGWHGWMTTQWRWAWAISGREWRTGKPGELQPMGLQRVGQHWVTE